ncbi:MAG: TRAP transporter large permease [Mesorhizobium sp.]|nr:TRAP transporter large permease [Mesorhizobium sp.]MCO5160226.1 TRAP transporter large permease [Mesorhizobium sp.]
MDPAILTSASLGMLVALILIGVPIGVALGSVSLVAIWLLFDSWDIAVGTAGSVAFSMLREYAFGTIPLFIIMGNFIAASGAARDLYTMTNRGLRRLPARLAVATVIGNTIFAAISGVSVAAAATFSRIAYPQMRRYNYDRPMALGVIAGSAMLGMLIPPSILLIFWGVLTEISIGKLFVAGILPGLMVAGLFILFLIFTALRHPEKAPYRFADSIDGDDGNAPLGWSVLISGGLILVLVLLVIGGIWFGLFTPTEAAGIGALCALLIAVIKGVSWRGILDGIIMAGVTTAPIMFLLLMAGLYSRFLVTGGSLDLLTSWIVDAGFGPVGLLIAMTLVWLALGTLLDSSSIILLTVPVFAPIAHGFGYDPLVFAIYGILIIEAGLLTPPFGILVFVVKSSVPENVPLAEVFRGAIPYWLLICLAAGILMMVPGIVTYLPNNM